MKIYIASSWKNQHAVEMLTSLLREHGHEVVSFVENNHGEQTAHLATENGKPMEFNEWVWSERGERSFKYDTVGATTSDLVIYIGPSGCDAWAEVGAAWASAVPILGLYSKGEQVGLMRRMVEWFVDYRDLVNAVNDWASRDMMHEVEDSMKAWLGEETDDDRDYIAERRDFEDAEREMNAVQGEHNAT